MVGAVIQSAIDGAGRRSSGTRSMQAASTGRTLEQLCVIDEDALECWAIAAALDRPDADLPTKKTALMYYRRACALRQDTRACALAERLAQELACVSAFDCGDLDLQGTPADPFDDAGEDVSPSADDVLSDP
jgi:hypothetical protein